MSTEATCPVDLSFCVDIDLLKLTIALGLIPNVTPYKDLLNASPRVYLEKEASESRNTVTLSELNAIVNRDLHMDMRNPDASLRMKHLFIDYQTILQNQGIAWLLEENPKVAMPRVFSVVKPAKLCLRLKSDLAFSQHRLRKEFRKLISHAESLSDALHLTDNGSLNFDSGYEKEESYVWVNVQCLIDGRVAEEGAEADQIEQSSKYRSTEDKNEL